MAERRDFDRAFRDGFVMESEEELDLPPAITDREKECSDSESEVEEEALNVFRKQKKVGKKSSWPQEVTDDIVDIVCNDQYLCKKLIFTNTKTSKNGEVYFKVIKEAEQRCRARGAEYAFNIMQTRNKFKRCISECKKAALTCKSTSGIKPFQENKDHGKWFNQLLPLVKSRESCQPEQAVEPSMSISPTHETREVSNEGYLTSNPSPGSSSSSSSGKSLPTKKRPFVPIKGVSGKKQKLEDLMKITSKAILDVSEQLKKDPMSDILGFFERENDRAREHELRYLP